MKGAKWERWKAIAQRIPQGAIGAEIGTHAGQMSEALFELVPNLRLIMVDRWEPYPKTTRERYPSSKIVQIDDPEKWKELYEGVLKLAACYPGSRVIASDSIEAAGEVDDGSLDFVFFDGSHSYIGASKEMAAWIPKVKKGGYLMGYDYGNEFVNLGIKKAVAGLGKPVDHEFNRLWAVKI